MTKKIIITQSNYIPWKGYFDSINIADEFVIYDDMQYTRRDWRNRNQIKTREGLQWLTIPVEVKGKYFQKINETKISDPEWGKDHWNKILHNYRNSKYFSKYSEIFEKIYLDKTEEFLSRVNYSFIKAVNEILGINTKLIWSSEFNLHEDRNERLIEICKTRGATDYYSGPAAKAYMDLTLFEKEEITVHWLDYTGYPEYRQLYGEFAHTVTILDLIFNEGPESKNFMKSF